MKFKRYHIKSKYIIVIVLVALLSTYSASKRVTTRLTAPTYTRSERAEKLKTYPRHESEFEKVSKKLTFMAYDKKTSASKETFFVDNGSVIGLSALELEISYYTTGGKLIHKRKVDVEQAFPPQETRKVDITSWDTQKSYHYINSVPSQKGSTPYTVRFKIISYIKA